MNYDEIITTLKKSDFATFSNVKPDDILTTTSHLQQVLDPALSKQRLSRFQINAGQIGLVYCYAALYQKSTSDGSILSQVGKLNPVTPLLKLFTSSGHNEFVEMRNGYFKSMVDFVNNVNFHFLNDDAVYLIKAIPADILVKLSHIPSVNDAQKNYLRFVLLRKIFEARSFISQPDYSLIVSLLNKIGWSCNEDFYQLPEALKPTVENWEDLDYQEEFIRKNYPNLNSSLGRCIIACFAERYDDTPRFENIVEAIYQTVGRNIILPTRNIACRQRNFTLLGKYYFESGHDERVVKCFKEGGHLFPEVQKILAKEDFTIRSEVGRCCVAALEQFVTRTISEQEKHQACYLLAILHAKHACSDASIVVRSRTEALRYFCYADLNLISDWQSPLEFDDETMTQLLLAASRSDADLQKEFKNPETLEKDFWQKIQYHSDLLAKVSAKSLEKVVEVSIGNCQVMTVYSLVSSSLFYRRFTDVSQQVDGERRLAALVHYVLQSPAYVVAVGNRLESYTRYLGADDLFDLLQSYADESVFNKITVDGPLKNSRAIKINFIKRCLQNIALENTDFWQNRKMIDWLRPLLPEEITEILMLLIAERAGNEKSLQEFVVWVAATEANGLQRTVVNDEYHRQLIRLASSPNFMPVIMRAVMDWFKTLCDRLLRENRYNADEIVSGLQRNENPIILNLFNLLFAMDVPEREQAFDFMQARNLNCIVLTLISEFSVKFKVEVVDYYLRRLFEQGYRQVRQRDYSSAYFRLMSQEVQYELLQNPDIVSEFPDAVVEIVQDLNRKFDRTVLVANLKTALGEQKQKNPQLAALVVQLIYDLLEKSISGRIALFPEAEIKEALVDRAMAYQILLEPNRYMKAMADEKMGLRLLELLANEQLYQLIKLGEIKNATWWPSACKQILRNEACLEYLLQQENARETLILLTKDLKQQDFLTLKYEKSSLRYQMLYLATDPSRSDSRGSYDKDVLSALLRAVSPKELTDLWRTSKAMHPVTIALFIYRYRIKADEAQDASEIIELIAGRLLPEWASQGYISRDVLQQIEKDFPDDDLNFFFNLAHEKIALYPQFLAIMRGILILKLEKHLLANTPRWGRVKPLVMLEALKKYDPENLMQCLQVTDIYQANDEADLQKQVKISKSLALYTAIAMLAAPNNMTKYPNLCCFFLEQVACDEEIISLLANKWSKDASLAEVVFLMASLKESLPIEDILVEYLMLKMADFPALLTEMENSGLWRGAEYDAEEIGEALRALALLIYGNHALQAKLRSNGDFSQNLKKLLQFFNDYDWIENYPREGAGEFESLYRKLFRVKVADTIFNSPSANLLFFVASDPGIFISLPPRQRQEALIKIFSNVKLPIIKYAKKHILDRSRLLAFVATKTTDSYFDEFIKAMFDSGLLNESERSRILPSNSEELYYLSTMMRAWMGKDAVCYFMGGLDQQDDPILRRDCDLKVSLMLDPSFAEPLRLAMMNGVLLCEDFRGYLCKLLDFGNDAVVRAFLTLWVEEDVENFVNLFKALNRQRDNDLKLELIKFLERDNYFYSMTLSKADRQCMANELQLIRRSREAEVPLSEKIVNFLLYIFTLGIYYLVHNYQRNAAWSDFKCAHIEATTDVPVTTNVAKKLAQLPKPKSRPQRVQAEPAAAAPPASETKWLLDEQAAIDEIDRSFDNRINSPP